jgi:hypothetical protein
LTAERRSRAAAGVHERLREILTQKKMQNVECEVGVVENIPVNPRTRKFQLIVDARASGSAASSSTRIYW